MFDRDARRAKVSFKSAAVLLALVGILVLPLWGAQPLSQDDITLLLIGGASQSKMVTMVEERGVDFQLTPDLIQKFRKNGASQALIDSIIKSNRQSASQHNVPVTQASSGHGSSSNSGISPRLPGSAPQVRSMPNSSAPTAQAQDSASAAVNQKVNQELAGLASGPAQAAQNDAPPALSSGAKKAAPAPDLSNPSPAEIQKIIQAFAAKEKVFKEARDNYTYHQINKVETLDADGKVNGFWEQDWDILFDNQGNRIEKVTYAPPGSLTQVSITEQDLDAMRSIQPFVMTTDELPEYEIKYLGHVKVDYITAYVFSVRPKEIKKHHQYFQGVIWVDDRDLQIVKTEGRQVPEITTRHGENLFPRFKTWRQQIDGKFWFPTFTLADDTLYFPTGPVHIREVIRYTDYRQFRSTSVIKAVQTIDSGKPIPPSNAPPPSSSPPPKK
ncbi:MAG TPA: hypothetical protein VMW51_11095 [Terriglobia bacterium]|nr:hypothetical protein [Terriglobia bacterium]